MNEPPPQWISILILCILLLLSMFFSSSETAFLSVNKLKIKYLSKKSNKKAASVEKILQNKQKFLTTSLISNSLVNILISVILTTVMLQIAGNKGLKIAVTAATIVILIFGEILPKSVALVFPESIALRYSAVMIFIMYILSPAVRLMSFITNFLLKLFKIQTNLSNEALTDDDLKDFFDTSEEHGAMHSYERYVLENILNYGDVSVKSIMTPRTEIVGIKLGSTVKEITDTLINSRFSRFPVYRKDIDDICGIFYIKDFLNKTATNDDCSVNSCLRKPIFVFENTELHRLQEIFTAEKQNMVIVTDEYGGVSGIVTLEDLNEEIFGNIADEYDIDEQILYTADLENLNTGSNKNSFNTIPGTMRLADLNENLGTSFFSEYHSTIGGFVMEKFGEVPLEGISIKIEDYTFTVIKTSNNRIEELKLH